MKIDAVRLRDLTRKRFSNRKIRFAERAVLPFVKAEVDGDAPLGAPEHAPWIEIMAALVFGIGPFSGEALLQAG